VRLPAREKECLSLKSAKAPLKLCARADIAFAVGSLGVEISKVTVHLDALSAIRERMSTLSTVRSPPPRWLRRYQSRPLIRTFEEVWRRARGNRIVASQSLLRFFVVD